VLAERTGKAYRLPTDSEWERAARAVEASFYAWGDDARKISRSMRAMAARPERVGQRPGERVGLYDISENFMNGARIGMTRNTYNLSPKLIHKGRVRARAKHHARLVAASIKITRVAARSS